MSHDRFKAMSVAAQLAVDQRAGNIEDLRAAAYLLNKIATQLGDAPKKHFTHMCSYDGDGKHYLHVHGLYVVYIEAKCAKLIAEKQATEKQYQEACDDAHRFAALLEAAQHRINQLEKEFIRNPEEQVVSIRTEQDAVEERAIKTLIKWRQHWERSYAEPPTEECGFKDTIPLWRAAGRVMKQRRISVRMK